MKRIAVAALVLALGSAGGCASIARGLDQPFNIVTEPPGAKVETTLGAEKGCPATPCTIEKVSRNAKFDVTISKPGYQSVTQQVTHETSVEGAAAITASFIIPGGILWSLIDIYLGAGQDLKPNPLSVTLEKAK
jgi:hypothetical protein